MSYRWWWKYGCDGGGGKVSAGMGGGSSMRDGSGIGGGNSIDSHGCIGGNDSIVVAVEVVLQYW